MEKTLKSREETKIINKTDTKNKFSNYKKMISIADSDWTIAESNKISNLNVTIESTNYFRDQYNRTFHHFCTTSYLGLDYHPALLKGALDALTARPSERVEHQLRCTALTN